MCVLLPLTVMPIFDFSCKACGHQFEKLVRKELPKCPKCESADLERLLSLPVVRGDGTHQKMLSNSKKRDARQAAEREYTQRQYEANHDD